MVGGYEMQEWSEDTEEIDMDGSGVNE